MEFARKINDLKNTRASHLAAATAANDAGNVETYTSEMESVRNIDAEIGRLTDLEAANARYSAPVTPAEATDRAAERGSALLKHDAVKYNAKEVAGALGLRFVNSTTLGSGTIVEPSGAGTNIRGGDGAYSSILDQVYAVDMTGMNGMKEPFVKTEMTANGQKVADAAGTTRTPTDPVFSYACINPYEVNVTSYVDRNINRLSPAAYEAKIMQLAIRALRRKACALIFNGDGQATPDMFGIKNAVDYNAAAMYGTVNVSAGIAAANVDLLNSIVFAYGGDEEMGGNARLYLTKADLQALGAIRGTNERRKLFDITHDTGNANIGYITDGGLIVPYSLSAALTSLSTAAAGASAIQTMLYGDPMNYELGMFGDFTVRVDESYKAAERMDTVLGDMFLGGNLIVDKGFVVATVAKA